MIQAARTTNKITAVILLMGLIGFGVTQHFGVIAQTTTVTTSTPSIVIDSTSDINSITPVDGSIVIIRTGAGSGVFSYDKDSSSTADGTDVINGPNSIGRLLKISGGSAVDSSNVLVVDNVAAFATTSSTEGKLFITRGYSTAGIGSGIYRYHATGRPTADGVLYFDAAGADDYLELLHNGVIDVTQAGAVGDGTTDDQPAIQQCIDILDANGGGEVSFPPNLTYAIADTVTIDNKKAIRLIGHRNPTNPGVLASGYPGSIKWIGSLNGTMLHIIDPSELTVENLEFRGGANGASGAAHAIHVFTDNPGWGVATFRMVNTDWCTRAAVLIEGNVDGGRNLWDRCRIMNRHTATGTAEYDAAVVYKNCGNINDSWIKCEIMHRDGDNNKFAGTCAFYITGGSPDIWLSQCYTAAYEGVFGASGTGCGLSILDHYSEDTNFLTLPAIANRQVLRNVRHISLSGGYSISAGGGGASANAFEIDGGTYIGDVTISGRCAVVINNNPKFDGAVSVEKRDVVRIGRDGNYANTSVAAINAMAFVPAIAAAQSGSQIYPNPYVGTVLPVNLTANATINAPTNVDSTWDVGREFEIRITGHASNTYTVTFNAAFALAERYQHSGPTATDVLTFRYDGTNWKEIGRSQFTTPIITLADAGATPSVSGVRVLKLTNSSTQDVSNLSSGVNGQQVEVHVDGNTTLDDSGGNFKFDSSIGGTFNGGSGGKVITLRLIDGVWTQTSDAVAF